MAGALAGRDIWRYGTVAVLAGSVLVAVGAVLNRQFLMGALLSRGKARRGEKRHTPRDGTTDTAKDESHLPTRRYVERERPISSARDADATQPVRDGEPRPTEERMRIR